MYSFTGVIFISPDCEPTRYLLNMNKHDKILKVKQELCSLAGRQDCEIILAEVLDWHISRILVRIIAFVKYQNAVNILKIST